MPTRPTLLVAGLWALSAAAPLSGQAPARVVVSPATLSLEVGDTVQLAATVYDAAGNVIDAPVWVRGGARRKTRGDPGERVALLPSVRKVMHGVAVAPDGRYAFVSVEDIGGEPGAVEAIDLRTLERIDSIDVGKQAGGIAFWKIDSHR